MRIVQLANAYGPVSGGLRTVVDTLGRGYVEAGHERILVVPGRRYSRRHGAAGLVVTMPGRPVGGGYLMIPRFAPVRRLLEALRPDSVEVSDKATLSAAGPWARRHGIGSILFSHERLDAVAAARFPLAWRHGHRVLRPGLQRWSHRLAAGFDAVVVASTFAAQEFEGTDADLRRIPLGVDLETFRPHGETREPNEPNEPNEANEPREPWRLLYVGRLSPEKNTDSVIHAIGELVRDGANVHLDVCGTGSLRRRLDRAAAGLPITFHGHLADRSDLASRMARADVVISPGPAETFGLTILEALACGTPVVTADTGAAVELIAGRAGLTARPDGTDLARAVTEVLSWPEAARRAAARSRAEDFPWSATIEAMIALHKDVAQRGSGR